MTMIADHYSGNQEHHCPYRKLNLTRCACRKSNTYIQMMESAEKWRRQNATNGMYCSRRRRVLVDRKVRASLVIVGRVRSQQMAEMPLAEHDNVVKTFPPDRTDRPFTISVLPRRSPERSTSTTSMLGSMNPTSYCRANSRRTRR